MRTLIRNAIVIACDGAGSVFRRGAVLVDGDRIADVGPSDDVEGRVGQVDRTIDGVGRKVVAPGFVSLHNHVGYTLFRGRAEDASLGVVTGMYFPMATVASREERLAVGSMSYAELLRSGVTTVLEMEEDADVFAPFVERLGARSAIGVMVRDVDIDRMAKGEFRFDPATNAAQMRQAVEFAERWHGGADGRITGVMAANMTISSSPAQLAAVRAAADRLGLRVSMHLGWGPAEAEIVGRLHGKHPFDYARENGMLAPDAIVAHCYHVDEHAKDVLVESGAHLAHCPLINSVRGCIAPVTEYRRRGVNVGIGVDNLFGDHFDAVRAAIQAARILERDASVMKAPEALELATMGSARALGMADRLGSLEKGKKADLQILNFRALGLAPILDPVQNLVYHAHSHDVETVMVDGRVVVEGGALKHVDSQRLVDDAETAAAAAWSRFERKYGGVSAT